MGGIPKGWTKLAPGTELDHNTQKKRGCRWFLGKTAVGVIPPMALFISNSLSGGDIPTGIEGSLSALLSTGLMYTTGVLIGRGSALPYLASIATTTAAVLTSSGFGATDFLSLESTSLEQSIQMLPYCAYAVGALDSSLTDNKGLLMTLAIAKTIGKGVVKLLTNRLNEKHNEH